MVEKKKRKKLPIDYMADEFMDQQLTTLDKNKTKKEEKENADANADAESTS